uniref:Uncharacterized protein n=1 Tax=viral metagenome TaxID=1070528 RepID=A0A6C0JR80_9ZZZZ
MALITADDVINETYIFADKNEQEKDLGMLLLIAIKQRWNDSETPFTKQDLDDFEGLNERERDTVRAVTTYFVSSDVLVANLVRTLGSELNNKTAEHFYAEQNVIEIIHSKVYAKMFLIVCGNEVTPQTAADMMNEYKSVLLKREYVSKIGLSVNIAEKITKMAFVEGIFFSISFAVIFMLQRKKVCNGFVGANKFIFKDEDLHKVFGCYVITTLLKDEISQEKIHEIAKEVYDIEYQFILEIIPFDLPALTRNDLHSYLQYCVDSMLRLLEVEPLFNVCSNPLEYMEELGKLEDLKIFEHRPKMYNIITVRPPLRARDLY